MKALQNYFGVIFLNWSEALQNKKTRNTFILTMLSYFLLFKYCRVVMTIFEAREGLQLQDFLLAHLPSLDFSALTFSLTYFALGLFIFSTVPNPQRFIKAMQAYTILLLMRTITIYLVPLEPPVNMIVLKDPVSNFFMNGGDIGGYIVKDLFFSGHVSAIALFYFLSTNKIVKRLFLTLAICIASLILLQHVHYLIDIVAAPFFSFLAIRIVMLANREISFPIQFSRKNLR